MPQQEHKTTTPEIIEPSVTADPDPELEAWTEQAQRALAEEGITVQDILDALPAAREDVVRETYGPEFMEELARAFADLHHDLDDSAPSSNT
jgi:hypothetical protein